MKHLKTFIDLLYDQDALLEAEFTIPSRLDPAALRKSVPNFEMEILIDDDFADMYGQLVFTHVTDRFVRMLWILGWPFRSLRVCTDDVDIGKELTRDEVINTAINDSAFGPDGAQVKRRSRFHTRAVKELARSYVSTAGVVTVDHVKRAGDHASGATVTQAVEDLNGAMKNSSATKVCRKVRRPTRLWGCSNRKGDRQCEAQV